MVEVVVIPVEDGLVEASPRAPPLESLGDGEEISVGISADDATAEGSSPPVDELVLASAAITEGPVEARAIAIGSGKWLPLMLLYYHLRSYKIECSGG